MREQFPNLESEGFAETSPATARYNCIAWAAGHDGAWWWPDPALVSFWPDAAPRAENLAAFELAFATVGFQRCANGELEAEFEKIAIYAILSKPTHAARQLRDGSWTSKLGRHIDIVHTLRGLEGPSYGQVAVFLKRPHI